MIFNIIGLMISGAGIYYLVKEKNDKESKKSGSIWRNYVDALKKLCSP